MSAGVTNASGVSAIGYVAAGNLSNGIIPTRMIAIGDSHALSDSAVGASSAANMHMAMLAANYGFGGANGVSNGTNFINSAVSGAQSKAYINTLNQGIAAASTDLLTGFLCFNDVRFTLNDPASSMDDRASMLAAKLSWFMIPESLKVRAVNVNTTTPNPAVTLTGNFAYWVMSADSTLNKLAIRGTTGTATFTTGVGNTVYVWYGKNTNSDQFQIAVDGVTYNVGGPIAYAADVNGSSNSDPFLLRITGLANTTHTVVVTPSPNAAVVLGVAAFDYRTIWGQSACALFGNVIPMTPGVALRGYDQDIAEQNSTLSSKFATLITPSVGASPYTYTLPEDGLVTISGGTVSAIDISRDRATTFNASGLLTGGDITAAHGDAIKITYTVAPTVKFYPIRAVNTLGAASVKTLWNPMIDRMAAMLRSDNLRIKIIDMGFLEVNGTSSIVPADLSSSDTFPTHRNDSGMKKSLQIWKRDLDPVFGIG